MNDVMNSIVNYPNYFKAGNGEMDKGKHGPECDGQNLYISIYHYLEYLDLNPRDYDTFKMGRYLTGLSSDYRVCKYSSQNFSINKFNLDLLLKQEESFIRFIR